jgi:hypothetical protein
LFKTDCLFLGIDIQPKTPVENRFSSPHFSPHSFSFAFKGLRRFSTKNPPTTKATKNTISLSLFLKSNGGTS